MEPQSGFIWVKQGVSLVLLMHENLQQWTYKYTVEFSESSAFKNIAIKNSK